MTHKTVVVQLTVHTPWEAVVFHPELYAVIPGRDSVVIVGRVTLDKLGLSFNSQIFQHAGARRSLPIPGIKNPDYLSNCRVALSIFGSQDAWGVELEPHKAMAKLVSRGSEMFMGPKEELGARREGLNGGVEEAKANGLPEEQEKNLRGLLSCHWTSFGEHCAGPPIRVEPMRIKLKPGAQAVKVRP